MKEEHPNIKVIAKNKSDRKSANIVEAVMNWKLRNDPDFKNECDAIVSEEMNRFWNQFIYGTYIDS